MTGLSYFPRTWGTTWRMLAVLGVAAAIATGCGSAGTSGGSGIRSMDDHGNNVLDATRIIADNHNIRGQINFGGDIDYFKLRCIAGVTYVLQIDGFPPSPGVNPQFDLTDGGVEALGAAILGPNGVQVRNSTGTDGGTPYDIAAAGGTGTFVGDSRIVWVAAGTGDYFIAVAHRRALTGIGDYVLRVASSQFGTILPSETFYPGDPILQSGRRFVFLFDPDQDPPVLFSGTMFGAVVLDGVEILESLDNVFEGSFTFIISNFITLPGNDEPEPLEIHIHVGLPNNLSPADSVNFQTGDDPHLFLFGIEIPTPFRSDTTATRWGEGTVPLASGDTLRFPVEVEWSQTETRDGQSYWTAKVTPQLRDGVTSGGTRSHDGPLEDPPLFRTFTGFPWYMDLHPQPDFDLDPDPIATSRPESDLYQVFETAFDMEPGNVVLRDGSRLPDAAQRGFSPFELKYDASLRQFQVARQFYDAIFTLSALNPDYTPYVGDTLTVHEGGPGEVGPQLFPIGTLPAPLPPPTASLLNPTFTIAEQPGFRTVIRQLNDSESTQLRDAFYGDGFYIELTDKFTGEPKLRAEGNALELSFLDPVTTPLPFRDGEPAAKVEKGTVNFATAYTGSGPITVVSNGETLGVLNQAVDKDSLPACTLAGDGGTLAAEYWPGDYYWHAHAEDGTMWDGHVTIESGGCETVLLEQQ